MIRNLALRIAGFTLVAAAFLSGTAYAEDATTTTQTEPTVVVTGSPDEHNPWG
ncbi:hypothetical protein ACWC9U_35230 [Streptomyces sp. 900116325]